MMSCWLIALLRIYFIAITNYTCQILDEEWRVWTRSPSLFSGRLLRSVHSTSHHGRMSMHRQHKNFHAGRTKQWKTSVRTYELHAWKTPVFRQREARYGAAGLLFWSDVHDRVTCVGVQMPAALSRVHLSDVCFSHSVASQVRSCVATSDTTVLTKW
jgi:hypothetical protein